ncbi:hypothetical protein SUGI_0031550 [Cryptomeria japonica]|uniref:dirigent protein 16 n=1 Tax=Cryptomeria japonica TaxID=3369 RepID=UPI002408B7FD|nr:dirigent protein 16 [Cryptomeria japonica]GLJ06085.1 hypothetical protein SUGI_0031550 [Cryptomeria japonica]
MKKVAILVVLIAGFVLSNGEGDAPTPCPQPDMAQNTLTFYMHHGSAVSEHNHINERIPDLNSNAPTLGGLNIGLGTVTPIEGALIQTPDLLSPTLGKGHGFYVSTSENKDHEKIQFMAFSAVIEENGEYEHSVNLFGVDNLLLGERQIAVVGGTGKFKNARGYAILQTVPHNVIKFTLHLTF